MANLFSKKRSSISVLIALAGTLGICLVGCVLLNNTQSEPVISSTDHTGNSNRVSPAQEATKMPDTDITLQDANSLIIDEIQQSAGGQKMDRETRAIWEQVGAKGKPVSREDVDILVAQLDAAHLNVVLSDVYWHGTAFFEPSHTRFPDSQERLTNQSPFMDEEYSDTFSYLLAIRNQRRADDDPFNDFEVHAWVHVISGGDKEDESWPPVDKTQPYMLNAIFPEFKLKYGRYYQENDERFINHEVSVIHQPKFRNYVINLLAGIVEDYDVDGIHLDHIRAGNIICFNNEALDYPGTENDYPGCQEDYMEWTRQTYGHEYTLWEDTDGYNEPRGRGRERVAAWQEHTVGQLVKSIHDVLKAIKPDLIITVASVRNDTSRTNPEQLVNGQVAWEWLEKGWIDAVFITAYTSDTQWVVDKTRIFREAIQDKKLRLLVFPGLGTYNLKKPDEFWSYLVVEQVDATMYGSLPGGRPLQPSAKGVGLFRATKMSGAAVQGLGEGPFKQPARPYWGESAIQ